MTDLLSIDDRNAETCFNSFSRIAKTLMNDYKLQVGKKFYRIIDCEFYFRSKDHDDCYVHGHERQKESTGEWYFHGSGLDLTIAGDKSHGGILIRGIAEVTPKASGPLYLSIPVIGPLNVCTEIFKGFGPAIQREPVSFGLVDVSMEKMGALMRNARVFAVPRVGLNMAIDTSDYHLRPYRFITFLHLPHREADRIKRYLTMECDRPISVVEFKEYKAGERW